MSIILQALRKAEASRREPERAALIEAPVERLSLPRRVPLWILPVVGVGIVSVGLAAYLLWPESSQTDAVANDARVAATATTASSPGPATPPAAPASQQPPTTSTPAEDAPAHNGSDVRMLALEARGAQAPAATASPPTKRGSVEVRDLTAADAAPAAAKRTIKPGTVEVRDLLAEEGLAPAAPPEDQSTRVATAAAANAPKVDSTTSTPPAAAAPPSAAAPAKTPAAPPIDELVANGDLNPPDLALEMHAYGPDPAARFVYINMRRYRIGDTTREGAVIEDITPEGAVLLLQGRRFLLESE